LANNKKKPIKIKDFQRPCRRYLISKYGKPEIHPAVDLAITFHLNMPL
jgi:hypothetical protein